MSWPRLTDYQGVVQHPNICFYDPELRTGQVVLNPSGLPRGVSGNFACVFEIRSGKKRIAVKCFFRQVPDRRRRYELISRYLLNHQLPWLVGFEYQERGIQVQGKPYPIVKMEWIDGIPLNAFVERHLRDTNTIYSLAQQWYNLVMDLQRARIAHGDLHHGNILVSAGHLRLVDYDGMFVPPLRGEQALELGHRECQHPKRSVKDYDESIDNFSALVIYLSLRALAAQPTLWFSFHTGDNLIFDEEGRDFEAPGQTPIWQQLGQCPDKDVRQLAEILEQACATSPDQLPNLEVILQEIRKPPKTLWKDVITGDIKHIEKRLYQFFMQLEGDIRERLFGKSQIILSFLTAGVRICSMAVMVSFLLGFPLLLMVCILNTALKPLIARGTHTL